MESTSKVFYYLDKIGEFLMTDMLPVFIFFGIGILFIIFIDKLNHWLDERYPIKEEDNKDEY